MKSIHFANILVCCLIVSSSALAGHQTRLRAIVNIPDFQFAILETDHTFPKQSNAPPNIITTSRQVRAGDRFEDATIKGDNFKFEVLDIDYGNETVKTYIEDEHGCIFMHPDYERNMDLGAGKMKFTTLSYPVFPRRQKQIKMVVQNWQGVETVKPAPVTLMITNPKQVSPVDWKPEPFPIVKQSGDLKVALEKIEAVNMAAIPESKEAWRFAPRYQILNNGQPTRDWTCDSKVFSDVTGNTHYSFLCPHEPALKLTMEFTRTADARFECSRRPDRDLSSGRSALAISNAMGFLTPPDWRTRCGQGLPAVPC